MVPTIRFLGGTETVTGSRYLIETEQAKLLVDCGLFQGPRQLRRRNWDPLPFDAASLDAVLLTHAHIDHSGYLPKLAKLGFKGRVYCTRGTRDLLQILLPDSGYLQEEDAARANRYGYTRHRPAEPLFTRHDAEASLGLIRAESFDEPFEPAKGITATFTRAGHIVGSACLSVRLGQRTLTFSGDVGRPNDPIMKPAALLPTSDYLVIESTYGDRRHPEEDVSEVLAEVVRETTKRGGVVVAPAFAVGRAQHLLHLFAELQDAGRIPEIPVYLDSPMAIDASDVFREHKADHGISGRQCRRMCELATYTKTADESKAIANHKGPKIIISASGMATGGRVLHHLKRYLPDPQSTVLLVGFQAAGTRGRALRDGAEEVKIHGEQWPVLAQVVQVDGLSAHADHAELIEWLLRSELSPKRVFVTHGEPDTSKAFQGKLRDAFRWDVVLPEHDSTWPLE